MLEGQQVGNEFVAAVEVERELELIVNGRANLRAVGIIDVLLANETGRRLAPLLEAREMVAGQVAQEMLAEKLDETRVIIRQREHPADGVGRLEPISRAGQR